MNSGEDEHILGNEILTDEQVLNSEEAILQLINTNDGVTAVDAVSLILSKINQRKRFLNVSAFMDKIKIAIRGDNKKKK